MNKLLSLIAVLFIFSIPSFADNSTAIKKAHKYKKQMHLQAFEVYYVTRQDLLDHYSKDGKNLTFPLNRVFDAEGKQIKMQTEKGVNWPILTCYQTLTDDLDTFYNSDMKKVQVEEDDAQWAQSHIQPVYNNNVTPLSTYNVFVYYPASMPLIKKRVKKLMNRVHEYQAMGKKVNLYLVVVDIFNKEA